jgi:hypothetical protein
MGSVKINLNELPTNLEPSMTQYQKVLDGTPERLLIVVMSPQIVDNRLYENGPVLILFLIRHNRDLRMIHSNGWFNHVDC